ncbi:undecaprenyl-diphosphate phosphatase [Candidatus Galacturonibacter soehngenii]|uniref:Undecaprenyl-diphosphatase n=1 Tax=Candidatus Galacturonatibacter soehngenii TaxID=2307010 RepID=A0A7V7QM36_9FIRM|nr:undecaprenyl-diphosphate phosphatase [Candidatus Galacturonibacter soehngenii]KAB1439410.1 undecaprenyl-diphosphate phosphatase [Candidatus Galacturonibacter soehngenii]MBA4687272.1 undecaprenyl-diphosphate phosphatase [Candidatus Galacturonibacter soehngenii]
MELIEIIKVIILGIVEGITEWLPISSTGHMILVDEFIQMNMSKDFKEMFFVVIQLGAIMAVVVLFWNKIFPFKMKKKSFSIDMDIMNLWFKIIVSCAPAAVIGLLFDDKLEEMFYNYQTVSATLIIYGILFLIIEKWNKGRKAKINDLNQIGYQTALIIGVFQVLALIPGTSRSGATIIGALLIGTSRTVAAEFTFYLAIPVMFGASLLKLLKFGFGFSSTEFVALILGMVTAFIVSVWAIKFLVGYIKKHDFTAFGIYRIILGSIVIFCGLIGVFN